jgi:translation initiation factor 2 beta subunit (eIF-2beta)/eIF-5
VNSTLKNYEKTLNRAFSITLAELEKRNSEYDEKVRQKKENVEVKGKEVRM